jgi:hypothetical protein
VLSGDDMGIIPAALVNLTHKHLLYSKSGDSCSPCMVLVEFLYKTELDKLLYFIKNELI